MYGAYNYVVVLAAGSRRVLAVLLGHGNKVTAVATSPSPAVAVAISGSKDRSVVAWSLESLGVLRKRAKLPAEVTAACVLPAAPATVALALANGLMCSWVWTPGALPSAIACHRRAEHALAMRHRCNSSHSRLLRVIGSSRRPTMPWSPHNRSSSKEDAAAPDTETSQRCFVEVPSSVTLSP